jgi:hypothetical protein
MCGRRRADLMPTSETKQQGPPSVLPGTFASVIPLSYYITTNNMRDTSELPVDEKHPQVLGDNVDSGRRRFSLAERSVAVVLSLLFLHIVWVARRPCSSPTFEERAHKILKENPLIGSAPAAAAPLTR